MTSERTKAMDDLIAQDADLIDFPLVASVRELLTDDSMEHLDFFTHNLVQAFFKHEPVPTEASYASKGRYNGDSSVSGIKA